MGRVSVSAFESIPNIYTLPSFITLALLPLLLLFLFILILFPVCLLFSPYSLLHQDLFLLLILPLLFCIVIYISFFSHEFCNLIWVYFFFIIHFHYLSLPSYIFIFVSFFYHLTSFCYSLILQCHSFVSLLCNFFNYIHKRMNVYINCGETR